MAYRIRSNRVVGEKDPYTHYILCQYIVKIIPHINTNGKLNSFDLIFRLFRPEDLKRVMHFIRDRLDQAKESQINEIRDYDQKEMERNLSLAIQREVNFSTLMGTIRVYTDNVFPEILKFMVKIFEEYLKDECQDVHFSERIKYLKNAFKLSDKEIEVLVFFHLMKLDEDLQSLFINDLGMNDINKSGTLFCKFFDISPYELQKMFSKKSTLKKTGLVNTCRKNGYDISNLVSSYLSGVADLDIMENFVKKADLDTALGLDKHNIPKGQLADVMSLLNTDHGLNILLHGTPGTGKSEFVKSLGLRLKKDVYFINQKETEPGEALDNRKVGIVAAMNLLDPKSSLIVVDECDEIINTSLGFMGMILGGDKDDSKAWLNEVLETTQHKVIWITNRVSEVDPSVKRRFSYSLEFKDLSYTQRLHVWKTQAEKMQVDFISTEDLEAFARKYKINAGGIALALKDVAGMTHLSEKKDKVTKLDSILNQHQSFVFGHKKLSPFQDTYTLAALNPSVNLESVLNSTRKFLEYFEGGANLEITNMNFLLHGPSGTGKTEFTKFLAQSLGKEILLKRMSDLQSKWVGETEKNIAKAFHDAESSGSILFLDEADSLFINRANAEKSWEVAQTNELLCQMENFKGILICATNFESNMDVAVMRRFNHKIKFDYLNQEGKELLATKLLGITLEEGHKKKLYHIQCLTPGDFKVVRQRNFFKDDVSADELILELQNEASYKRITKPMGLSL